MTPTRKSATPDTPTALSEAISKLAKAAKVLITPTAEKKSITKESRDEAISKLNEIVRLAERVSKLSDLDATVIDSSEGVRAIIREELDAFMVRMPATPVTPTDQRSYASIAAKPKRPKQTPPSKPAIIIASDNANAKHDDVLKSFRKGVSFKDSNYAPAKITPVSNNKVRVEFDNAEQRDATLKKLETVSQLKAENAKTRRPMIILKGISKDVNKDELASIIRQQNTLVNECAIESEDIKLRFERRNNNKNGNLYNAVFEVTPSVRNAMLTLGRINIDHQRVNASDFSAFLQCYKCLQ